MKHSSWGYICTDYVFSILILVEMCFYDSICVVLCFYQGSWTINSSHCFLPVHNVHAFLRVLSCVKSNTSSLWRSPLVLCCCCCMETVYSVDKILFKEPSTKRHTVGVIWNGHIFILYISTHMHRNVHLSEHNSSSSCWHMISYLQPVR